MAENKHFRTSLLVLLGVVLLAVVILQWVGGVLKGGAAADMSPEAVAERIRPIGTLNLGEEPAAAAAVPVAAEAEQSPAPAASAAPVAAAPAPAPAAPAAKAAPAPVKAAARSGEQVVKATCQVCHNAGIAGAPKLGDKAAWAPRIKQGMNTLVDHALKGFKGMPPRGTCGNCSDQEIKSAVEYMVKISK